MQNGTILWLSGDFEVYIVRNLVRYLKLARDVLTVSNTSLIHHTVTGFDGSRFLVLFYITYL